MYFFRERGRGNLSIFYFHDIIFHLVRGGVSACVIEWRMLGDSRARVTSERTVEVNRG
jgi:hypothetical protein